MLLELVIDGHDGAAKTPVVEGVRERLIERGYSVGAYAPFQLVKKRIPEPNINSYWDDGRTGLAVDLLRGVIEEVRGTSTEQVILYDRHWMTIFTEIEGTELAKRWDDFPPTYFMSIATPEIIKGRKRFDPSFRHTASDQVIEEYCRRYNQLAELHSSHIVGRFVVNEQRVDLTVPINEITRYALSKLESRTGTGLEGEMIRRLKEGIRRSKRGKK